MHRSPAAAVLRAALAVSATALAQAQGAAGDDAAAYERVIRPLFVQHCCACHSTAKQKGDLDLEQFATLAAARQQPKIWLDVVDKLANGEMPPAKAPQPAAAVRAQLLAWAQALLAEVARATAGDPGPVVLRRLSNAEYTYAIRDLTGVASLDPAKEFPVDCAAGEGFTNVGNALVMSPTLVAKYLAAAKSIAEHAVLLPDGLRFAAGATRRDWTDELLARIRALYRQYTDPAGANMVDLQGIVFATNGGGRLPVAKYFDAALLLRDTASHDTASHDTASHDTGPDAAAIAAAARARGLSPKYLALLWRTLTDAAPSPLLDPVRASWRGSKPGDGERLAATIAPWQQRLFAFRTVGHIGKVGGPKAWLEPASALAERQELRCKVPAAAAGSDAVTMYLVAGDAGDGNAHDDVVWHEPRLVRPGRPDLPLRSVRGLARSIAARRESVAATVVPCLAAAAEFAAHEQPVAALAHDHGVATEVLAAWLSCLGLRDGEPPALAHFATPIRSNGGSDCVQGWGAPDLPCLLANSSDQLLRIPYPLRAHSIAMHPTPTLRAVAGWRCPVAGRVRVAARIQHVHTACGNGVEWAIELRRGALRLQFANGLAIGSEVVEPSVGDLDVQQGDFVVVAIGAHDGDHTCDTTAVDLELAAADGAAWSLAQDVSPDVLAGNPHADRQGHAAVWHFFSEPDPGAADHAVPAGSLLGRWLRAVDATERQRLAQSLQELLASRPRTPGDDDARLYARLTAFDGPLYSNCGADDPTAGGSGEVFGPDPAQFTADDLAVHAPSIVAVRLPKGFADGCELVTTGALDARTGGDGSVQLQLLTKAPAAASGLVDAPIVVDAGSAARQRLEAACDAFRAVFPAALCYEKIVPVDEPVTLTLFHREDGQLARLMLDDAERQRLDRLWAELHFVAQDAIALVDVYDQLWQFATQDADPKVFEPLREPIRARAAACRGELLAAEPRHLDAVLAFADRAWRRPLTTDEATGLRALYQQLRGEAMPHDEAIRLLLARVLLAPAFLYHGEQPAAGSAAVHVSAHELASRLSFFLWSSTPDAELRAAADSGALLDPDVLAAQARRMLAAERTRRLAIEFGCAWLQIRGFDEQSEKSERLFPGFRELRSCLGEEAVRWLADLFQRDGAVHELLDADHTFVNGALAAHYGIPGVTGGEWRRVDGVRQYGRGGVLGLAATLASQSGASRTSPILRGNWVAEVLLGDRLPRPPKDVPKLPEDEVTEPLTMRQLTERHRSDPACAHCHARIDPFGFALEGFDAIGRRRTTDLGGRPVDTRATAPDGASFDGIDGLRDYLLTRRRAAFEQQFCKKLLGYALGRAVQLSDQPLLDSIRAEWPAHGHRVGYAIERIVRSQQFRCVRGADWSER